MTNGITFYKMRSPYEGDVTKNCALTGPEVDNNFFTLEGRDVKSISVDGDDIVLNLLNGETLRANEALKELNTLDNFITKIDFNAEEGILSIHKNNGEVNEIKGFTTLWNTPVSNDKGLKFVSVDSTLKGNGLSASPIGVSKAYQTGQYRPVNEFIVKKYDCPCSHPKYEMPKIGDRFLVEEPISEYGLLYDYRTVMQIACDLQRSHSKWRIPTKEDWDDMLNAVEPHECNRNHNISTPNKYLGEWAGKLLKTTDKWAEPHFHPDHCDHHHHHGHNHCDCDDMSFIDDCTSNSCEMSYCGEPEAICYPDKDFTKGLDKYGFSVMPTGYADDGCNSVFFGERSGFWTATNMKLANAFIKRFDYNRNTVYQDIIAGQNYYSLRLVKDYDGDNFVDSEEILGQNYPTVLMPSQKNGKSIWTAINIYATKKHYKTLIPNNGLGISFTKKYFIDEWDGKNWIRKEMKEGESVVIINAPHKESNVEYRIIEGELVNTTTKIINSVYDKVNIRLEELNKLIADETLRSVSKDNEHDMDIADLKSKDTVIEIEIENIKNSINVIDERLDGIDNSIETINGNIDTLSTEIETERNERINKDNEHDEQISKLQEKVAKSVDWTDIPTEELPNRKAIVLPNHDIILGTDTNGGTYNLAMVSKWNVADFGSSKLPLNLNSSIRPTVNDKNEISYMSDLEETSTEIKKEIADFKEETANNFTAVHNKIDEAVENLDNKINNAVDTLNEDIAKVDGQLLINEGSSYNDENGVLTLKSKDNTNDINIQFKFGNFGTF